MASERERKADSDIVKWTKREFNEFTILVDMGSSQIQMDRIESRLKFKAFIEKHGKEKCDAMFAELTKNDKK